MKLRKALFASIFALVFSGCASMTSTTGEPGISYGMSLEEVTSTIKSNNKIVEQSSDRVVAIGIWDVMKIERKKVFTFNNGKLVTVQFVPVKPREEE